MLLIKYINFINYVYLLLYYYNFIEKMNISTE